MALIMLALHFSNLIDCGFQIPVTYALGSTLEPWKFKFNLKDTFRVNWVALYVPYSW